jgi:hypothetical protein
MEKIAGTTVLFVLYQTAPSTMVVERATLHAQKLDLQDLATHFADAPKRLAMLGCISLEPPTRCGGPPFASLSNWQ